jgi:putative phosphoribosyl transferase
LTKEQKIYTSIKWEEETNRSSVMVFEDRRDAGEKLAQALEKYKDQNALVLAIPRGGVEVGYQVAKYLNATLSILVSRKLPFPDEPEAGFGAVAEDGSTFVFKNAAHWLSKKTVAEIIDQQNEEIQRRIAVLREGAPLPKISGKAVILVDDGLAMGSTMRAAISLCKNKKAQKIIVAVPVSGHKVAKEVGELVDEIVVLSKPAFFRAVAQAYANWYDVSDEEVMETMEKWQRER